MTPGPASQGRLFSGGSFTVARKTLESPSPLEEPGPLFAADLRLPSGDMEIGRPSPAPEQHPDPAAARSGFGSGGGRRLSHTVSFGSTTSRSRRFTGGALAAMLPWGRVPGADAVAPGDVELSTSAWLQNEEVDEMDFMDMAGGPIGPGNEAGLMTWRQKVARDWPKVREGGFGGQDGKLVRKWRHYFAVC